MNRIIKSISIATLALIFAAGVTSCKKKKDDEPAVAVSGYGLWLQVGSYPNTSPYVLSASTLKEGSVSLSGNGSEVTNVADYGIIPGKEYYYYFNPKNSKFSKFKLENSRLNVIKEVQLTHLSNNDTYAWLDAKTLVMFGTNGNGTKVLYSSVNVNTMVITNGEVPVEALPSGYISYGLGGAEYSDGKFYLGLTYNQTWPAYASPNFYVAVVNADFTLNTTLSDNRSLGAGAPKLWMSGSFVDESGDIYLLSGPYSWNSDGTLPAAVYRLKKGAAEFDNSYFFDTKASSIGYNATGMWYVGNGVAILRYQNTSLSSVHDMQFAAVNIADGSIRKKLTDLPNDKGETIESITVEGGKAYILANSETGKDYVWEYDPSTDAVKPGLEISGGYDYLLRVDVLK